MYNGLLHMCVNLINLLIHLLRVVGFELEATRAKIMNMNKDILHVVSKVEQVRVVLDTMMTMNDEQEKNLKLLQKKNVEQMPVTNN